MKRRIRLTEGDLRKIVNRSVMKILREGLDEFEYGDSYDLGRGRHRQTIIYRGKEIGYLLTIEKNWFAPLEEKYILPDVEYGMDIPQGDGTSSINVKNPMEDTDTMPMGTSGLLDGARGWIEFKVFDDYDEAFNYASQNFELIAYLFDVGDYD